jgi:hypothetical protein
MKIAMLPIEANNADEHRDNLINCPSPIDFSQKGPFYFDFFQSAVFNVSFPTLVTNAVDSAVKNLGGTLPPFMWLSKAGHDKIGAVIYVSDIQKPDFKFDSSKPYFGREEGLVGRVSYGGSNKVRVWDISEMNRLHLSMYSFRRFVPVEPELASTLSRNSCMSNEIYFSLRWLKNDSDWEFDDPYMNMNHSFRTSWIRTVKVDSIHHAHKKKKSLIPESGGLDEYGQPPRQENVDYSDVEKISESLRAKTTSHSGYDVTLNFLKNFGDVTAPHEIKQLTPEQGIEYLFQKVAPAMRNFLHQ